MKIETQSSAALSELGRAIQPMSVAMLTHRDAEGVLVSRPMEALEMDRDGALWFLTALSVTPVEQLAALNLSFSETASLAYVSLSGRGELHADRDRLVRQSTVQSRPWRADGPESSNRALLKFVIPIRRSAGMRHRARWCGAHLRHRRPCGLARARRSNGCHRCDRKYRKYWQHRRHWQGR